MKLMTYNIRLGMQRGLDRIADIIGAQDPDVVALQEVGRHWTSGPDADATELLADRTGLRHTSFLTTIEEQRDDDRIAEYGHSVLSRWPLGRVDSFEFDQYLDEPRRAMLLRIDAPDVPFFVLAVHLSHIEGERQTHGKQLLDILDGIEGLDGPLFMVGDLNETPDGEPWMQELLERFVDACPGGLPTYPAEEPERRIDYILSSGGRWLNCEVLDELSASDHRPVVAQWRAD